VKITEDFSKLALKFEEMNSWILRVDSGLKNLIEGKNNFSCREGIRFLAHSGV